MESGGLNSSASASAEEADALRLRGISKTFATKVLDDVELTLRRGEVHALLGQNGSGKSTLIKILAGYHRPDPGAHAEVEDVEIPLGHGSSAHDAGIRFIHQDLALVPDLTVVDNLALGEHYEGRRWLSPASETRAAQALLDRLDLNIEPRRRLGTLTPAEQTMVAVARALRDGIDKVRVLVLDEPTASLTISEVRKLFGLIRTIRKQGGTVLYVTHRLEEVFEIADRVTVLRDGKRVGTAVVADLDHDKLVEMIIGKPADEFHHHEPVADARGDVAMAVQGITGASVHDVSLQIHRGEIVGVAGIIGSGCEELPYLIFGARPTTAGTITVNGQVVRTLTPAGCIAAGMAFVPADRKTESSTQVLSLRENLTLPRLEAKAGFWMRPSSERRDTVHWLKRMSVVPPLPERAMASLSGGNQQKVVLGRWFRCQPRIMVFHEPTQGVDVGAKAGIYDALEEAVREGAGVLVISSDAEELAAICDRVLVMRNGRIDTELPRARLSADSITRAMLKADRVAGAVDAPQQEEPHP